MRLKGIVSRFLFGSVCLSCGCGEKPLDPWLCENCRELLLKERHGSAVFENAFSLYNMGPVSRALIHGLKYSSMPGLAAYLVKSAGDTLKNFKEWLSLEGNVFFVPVPLHPSRFRERGYNQTEKVALALAAYCNGKVWKALGRRSFSVSQTKLSKSERVLNVAGAFVLKKRMNVKKEDCVVIVDDVFTTGATTGACAYALKRNGYHNIKICSLLYEKPISAELDFVADKQEDWLL